MTEGGVRRTLFIAGLSSSSRHRLLQSPHFPDKEKGSEAPECKRSCLRALSGPCRRAYTAVQCLTATDVQPVRAPRTHPFARERVARGRACDTTATHEACCHQRSRLGEGTARRPPSRAPTSSACTILTEAVCTCAGAGGRAHACLLCACLRSGSCKRVAVCSSGELVARRYHG